MVSSQGLFTTVSASRALPLAGKTLRSVHDVTGAKDPATGASLVHRLGKLYASQRPLLEDRGLELGGTDVQKTGGIIQAEARVAKVAHRNNPLVKFGREYTGPGGISRPTGKSLWKSSASLDLLNPRQRGVVGLLVANRLQPLLAGVRTVGPGI